MSLADWKCFFQPSIPDDVLKFHHSCTVVDLHIDTFLIKKMTGADIAKRGRPVIYLNALQHAADVPRLREGGVNVPCWGVVVFPFARKKYFELANAYLDMVHEFHDTHPNLLTLALTAADIERSLAAGGIAGILGLEGAHPLMGRIGNLEALVARGIRYITLAHFTSNEAAIAAVDKRPLFNGLSDFGREVVDYCDANNLLIDLAHVAPSSFLEAASRTKNPVIVSHTGVRGVHDMWRNLFDDEIDAVAETGGVIGLILHSKFLGKRFVETLETWADHVEYVKRRVGVDHVAIGSDLDGLIVPPREFRDVADMPQLTYCLARRGWSEDELRKILGLNAMRVFKQVLV